MKYPGLRILVLFLCSLRLVVASVETVELIVSGTGAAYKEAIDEALVSAVAQNSGQSIEAASALSRIAISVETKDSASAVISESVSSQVKAATKGEVLGYSVIEQSGGSGQMWNVKLSVRLAKFIRSEQTKRLRMAVANFRSDAQSNALGALVTVYSKSALVQTRKFAVLERDWEKEENAEGSLLASGKAPADETTRLGQRLGADIILIGTVNSFWVREPAGEEPNLLDVVAKAQVEFRLVDFATGQLKVSKVINVSLNQAQLRLLAKNSQITSPEIPLALKIGNQIADTVTEIAYPITIVEASPDGEVVLSQGGDRIIPGAKYAVYSLGPSVVDPATGESLGAVETFVGIVEITRSEPKMSYARAIERATKLTKNMIVRSQLPLDSKNSAAGFSTDKENDKNW